MNPKLLSEDMIWLNGCKSPRRWGDGYPDDWEYTLVSPDDVPTIKMLRDVIIELRSLNIFNQQCCAMATKALKAIGATVAIRRAE